MLFNEHDDVYLLFHDFLKKLSPLNWTNSKKKSSKGKKDAAKSVHEARYSTLQIMTLKRSTRGKFRVDIV